MCGHQENIKFTVIVAEKIRDQEPEGLEQKIQIRIFSLNT